jgi:hypothetical protein
MAAQESLLVLVVLYKLPVLEAPTIRSLLRCAPAFAGSRLLVWDNSPVPSATDEDLRVLREAFPTVECVHTPENLSLSTLYNRVIRSWLGRGEGFLLLLDHDTELDPSFPDRAREAIAAHPETPLFLPIVRYRGRIVSPADFFYVTGRPWRRPRVGLVRSRFRTAINSGMIVSSRFLRTRFTGYDERFRFYGTDNYFMKQYARLESHFCVVDAEVAHQLDFFEDTDVSSRLRRLKELNRATVLLNGDHLLTRLASLLYVTLVSCVQALRHRDRRFLGCMSWNPSRT